MTGSYHLAFWLSIFFYACGSVASGCCAGRPGVRWTSVELPVYFFWITFTGSLEPWGQRMDGFAGCACSLHC